MSTAIHEASHVVAALMLGRRVESVELDVGLTWWGEAHGTATIPGEVDAGRLLIALIGYMSTGIHGWPPAYGKARGEDLENLDLIIRTLGITEEQYDEIVDLTREMLADENFRPSVTR